MALSSRASAIRGFTSPTAKVRLFSHSTKYFRYFNIYLTHSLKRVKFEIFLKKNLQVFKIIRTFAHEHIIIHDYEQEN